MPSPWLSRKWVWMGMVMEMVCGWDPLLKLTVNTKAAKRLTRQQTALVN